ncbi:hypothetical protein BKA83DRAFT_4353124 [Pisolithus microcarpus]|nr:hypothetical protein BKA83DRAFT_4353124 [Pisolithus microcarpus]
MIHDTYIAMILLKRAFLITFTTFPPPFFTPFLPLSYGFALPFSSAAPRFDVYGVSHFARFFCVFPPVPFFLRYGFGLVIYSIYYL